MSKRTRPREPESSEADTPYEEHNFSPDIHRLCLSLMGGAGGPKIDPAVLAQYEGAPSRATLYSWRNSAANDSAATAPAAKRGRPSKFTQDELDVLGGYVLYYDEKHQVCGINEVQDFIKLAFAREILSSSVSVTLHQMGFSSHRTAPLSYRYGKALDTTKAIEFLRGLQRTLEKKVHAHDRKRIVAIDQISFWDCGIVSSSFSPIGGGQPRIWDSPVGNKHIVLR